VRRPLKMSFAALPASRIPPAMTTHEELSVPVGCCHFLEGRNENIGRSASPSGARCIVAAMFRLVMPTRVATFALACVTYVTYIHLLDSDVWAAEIRVRSVDSCAEASAITEQADNLKQTWRVRVDAINRADGSRRSRAITGHGCAELAEAAAVAIAMSADADVHQPAAADDGPPPPPVAAVSTVAPPTPSAAVAKRPPPARMQPAVGLALAVDTGALPGVALGSALQASLRRQDLRLVVQAAFFPSQETRVAGGIGGDFQLVLGGLLGCFAHGAERLTLSACAGGEVGRVTGSAIGVSTPRLGSALWAAGRAEVGAELTFASRFLVFVQGGVALPAKRPTFVVDGTVRVHQADGLTARSMLGIAVTF